MVFDAIGAYLPPVPPHADVPTSETWLPPPGVRRKGGAQTAGITLQTPIQYFPVQDTAQFEDVVNPVSVLLETSVPPAMHHPLPGCDLPPPLKRRPRGNAPFSED